MQNTSSDEFSHMIDELLATDRESSVYVDVNNIAGDDENSIVGDDESSIVGDDDSLIAVDECKFPINDFSLDQMCKNPSIVIIGKRGSDDLKLIADILTHFSDTPSTIISSVDEHANNFSKIKNINIEKIHHKNDLEIIKNLLKNQKEKKRAKMQDNESVQIKQVSDELTDPMKELLQGIKNITESSLEQNRLQCTDVMSLQKMIDRLAEHKRDLAVTERLTQFNTNIQQIINGTLSQDSLVGLQKDFDQINDLKKMNICDFLLKNVNEKKKQILDHLLVMSDGPCSSKFSSEPYISDLLFNGRCYNLAYVLKMQYSLGISPSLLSNFDYIFLFRDDYLSSQKHFYEHYARLFPDFKSFKKVYDQLTKDGGCMVIRNTGSRKTLSEKIAYYRPKCEITFIE